MGFKNEIQTHKHKAWKSLCTSFILASLGMHCGLFGPTMLDLQILVNTTVDQITLILPMRAFGKMIGSTACGFILPYTDHQIVLLCTVFVLTLTIIFAPLCTALNYLFFIMIINGTCGGFLINCSNNFIMHQWGKENGPFMQLIHFSFGLGAFISPFFAEPFLKPLENKNFFNLNITSSNITDSSNDLIKKNLIVDSKDSNVKWAYFIVGFLTFVVWVIFLITYIKDKSNEPHPSRYNDISNEKKEIIYFEDLDKKNILKPNDLKKNKELNFFYKFILIGLAASFMYLVFGIELSVGTILPTFAVKSNLHLTKTTASFLASFYWGCFTFFRLFTMIMVNFFSPKTMLLLDLLLIMIGNLILLPFGNVYEWALWIGSGFLGIGVSSVYPTLWGFIENLTPVTSKMTSVVTVFACIGEFVSPVLIGNYIEIWPIIYIYMIFGYSVLSCFTFALCCLWARVIEKHKNSS